VAVVAEGLPVDHGHPGQVVAGVAEAAAAAEAVEAVEAAAAAVAELAAHVWLQAAA
jgi:hypothetical protein